MSIPNRNATPGDARARLRDIIARRSFGRGEITLASGRKSDFYFNLKPTMLDAEGAALLAELTLDALQGERIDYVGGLEMGAVPLAGAIAQLSFMRGQPIQAFFVRKKPKDHGAKLSVEGLAPGETACRQARGDRGRRHHHRRLRDQGGGSGARFRRRNRHGLHHGRPRGRRRRELPQARLDFRSLYKAAEFLKR